MKWFIAVVVGLPVGFAVGGPFGALLGAGIPLVVARLRAAVHTHRVEAELDAWS